MSDFSGVDNFMPNREERYKALVDRIPSGWGKWISVGDGWADLVIQLDKDIAAIDPDYEIHQVKEKFGLLRVYESHHHDLCNSEDWNCEIHRLIAEAEEKSSRMCETCGQPGILRGKGWVRTLCDEHSEGYSPYSEKS